MPRKVIGWDWTLLPPLPKVRSRSARLHGCLNENGNPKVRWPNAASAAWYRTNLPRLSIKPCEPYECPTCAGWHLGRPRRPPRPWRPPPNGALAGVWRAAQSMIDFDPDGL